MVDEKRISIYVAPPVAALFSPSGATTETRSGRLGTVARRYLEIVRDEAARLPFSAEEWPCLLSAGMEAVAADETGTGSYDPIDDGRYLWAVIQDYDGPDDVDVASVSQRVRALSPAARIALVETIRAYWETDNRTASLAERLSGCGVATAAWAAERG